MKEFGVRLRTLRLQKNISQAELSRMLEINRQTVNNWEKKNIMPEWQTIIKVADILECDVAALLGSIGESRNLQHQEFMTNDEIFLQERIDHSIVRSGFFEKNLEDYICNNIEKFILKISDLTGLHYELIHCIGRQVRFECGICDLVFKYNNGFSGGDNFTTLIIVELKAVKGTLEHYSQLMKYVVSSEHYDVDDVIGILVTDGISNNLEPFIIKPSENIYFMQVQHSFDFGKISVTQ